MILNNAVYMWVQDILFYYATLITLLHDPTIHWKCRICEHFHFAEKIFELAALSVIKNLVK